MCDALILYLYAKQLCCVGLSDLFNLCSRLRQSTASYSAEQTKLGNVRPPLAWIKDFMLNRQLIMRYQNASSIIIFDRHFRYCLSVPLFGRCYFSVFINDMPSCDKTVDVSLFADDTKARIQQDLIDKIFSWSKDSSQCLSTSMN